MSDSNAKTPGQEALSPAVVLMRKAAEQAVNEAMEDQFPSFLEDCVSGSGSPRNGHCERKVLTTVGEINVRVPRDRLGLFVAKWSQTYPSFRKYLTEPGLFSFYRFPKAVWRPLCTSNAVEAFRACLKRKLRARLALHSLKNGCCLIAVEAERCNRSGRNRRLTGFDELTADEVKTLGMER